MGAQPGYGGIRFYDTEDLGTQVFAIGKDGSFAQANQSMRAPIFYDLDDTSYYVDPASTTSAIFAGSVGLNNTSPINTAWGNASNTKQLSIYGSNYAVINLRGDNAGARTFSMGVGDNQFYMAYDSNVGRHNIIVNSSGNVTAAVDFRAPIFYDSNNTGFYVDPASTSNLNVLNVATLNISGAIPTNTSYLPRLSGRDFGSGTLVQTSINYAVTNGDPFVIEITGNSYGQIVPWDIQIQGYIYADTIINTAGISNGTNITGIRAINYNGNLCFWWPRQSYWNGFTVYVYTAYDTFQPNRVTSITDVAQPTTAKQVIFTVYQNYSNYNSSSFDATFNRLYSNTDVRAPLYYDSDNTGFYLDPASNSELNRINTVRANNFLYLDNNYGHSVVGAYASTRFQGVFAMGDAYKLPADGTTSGNLYGIAWSYPSAGGAASNLNTHGALILENGSFLAALSGSIRSRDDMRSPIFYDSNNTGFYADLASTSNINRITNDTNQRFNIHFRGTPRSDITSDQNYWTTTQGWGTGYGTWDTAWAYGFGGFDFWGSSTGHPQGSGYIHAQGIQSGLHYATADSSSAYGWQMVGAADATSNRYWARGKWGGSTSAWKEFVMYGAGGGGSDLRAPIYYDSDNTNYYLDPTSITSLRTVGSWRSDSSTWDGEFSGKMQYHSDHWYIQGANLFIYRNSGGSNVFTINQSGTATANADMRSPIFYDNNDTGYYGDFASTSRINAINYNNLYWASNTAYGFLGPNVYADTINSGVASDPLELCYYSGSFTTTSGSMRAPIFYDRDNTGYYVDPASVSNLNNVLMLSAVSNNNNGLRNVMPGGGVYVTSASSVAGAIVITLPQTVFPMIRFTVKVYTYDGLSFDINCGGHTSGGLWYNTFAYMTTQNRPALNVRFTYGSGLMYVYIGELGQSWSYPQVFITDVQVGYTNYEYDRWDDGWTIGFNSSTYNNISATQTVYPPSTTSNNSNAAYASIYYDSNNTAYYADPASTSLFNALTMAGSISTPTGTSIYIGSQNVSTSARLIINWHTDSDYNYLIGKRAGAWTQPMDIAFYTGVRYHAHNAYGGHRFFTTGYDGSEAFSVGNGDSNVRVINNLFTPIVYDSNNTAYYTDPASTSVLNALNINGGGTSILIRQQVNSPTDGYTFSSGAQPALWIESTFGDRGGLCIEADGTTVYGAGDSGWVFRVIDEDSYQGVANNATNAGLYTCFQVNQSLNGGAYVRGSFVATGEITAYGSVSDINKKENIVKLDNALEKISQLNGYTFNYKGETNSMIGVIAQEVEKVFPQLVYTTEAGPGDEPIMAVRYENITAVLIEAIKEQQTTIDSLANQVADQQNTINSLANQVHELTALVQNLINKSN